MFQDAENAKPKKNQDEKGGGMVLSGGEREFSNLRVKPQKKGEGREEKREKKNEKKKRDKKKKKP